MKVAVHLHLHYADLLQEILSYLQNIPVPFDLYITVTHPEQTRSVLTASRERLSQANVTVLPVENKGRDVKPFYTDLGPLLLKYDIVGHVHAKKSLFNKGATDGWLQHLLQALMGSVSTVTQIFETFANSPAVGLVYPSNFHRMPYWANAWLSNRGHAGRLLGRMGISEMPSSYFPFPVGNMFWARTAALKPLFGLNLAADDYPSEGGQMDGEIMHALERLTPIVSHAGGFENLIVESGGTNIYLRNDREGADLSPYFGRSLEELRVLIDDPQVKVVSFDIFDTLVCRKICSPTDLFDLMQSPFEKACGGDHRFSTVRMQADADARSLIRHPKMDVCLDDIYTTIGNRYGLATGVCNQLKELELSLESRFLERRESVIAMLDYAFEAGKKVILTSDMYLGHDQLAGLLDQLAIRKYHALYVSSHVGYRKDRRTLFPHILKAEGVNPVEIIHVGDNEHSDLQIPGDLGIRTFHVLKPAELFARTKWGRALGPMTAYENVSLAMGLNKLFDHPFPVGDSYVNGDLRLFGYFYFGPALLAFVKWVADSARAANIERLYFLSRDAEVPYKIYRLLEKHSDEPMPEARYLEISRIALAMPLARDKSQVDKLLSPDFYKGSLRKYVEIRTGIDLAVFSDIDVSEFGFASIDQPVTVPADLDRLKQLVYQLLEVYRPYFLEQKKMVMGYLRGQSFFDDAPKAVVDIGYSGTIQSLLNQVSVDPVHGYYMITYDRIDSVIDRSGASASGYFGDRIGRNNALPVDRYSLFYEMILSSTKGPVKRYARNPTTGEILPVFAKVSVGEEEKLKKLPVIHGGILAFCEEYLSAMGTAISYDNPRALYEPFIHFLEHPLKRDVEMLAGCSVDDDFCGNGVLYWSPIEASFSGDESERRFLWKYMVRPFAPAGPEKYFSRTPALRLEQDTREREIREWYRRQYEVLPGWYKTFGHVFKIIKRKKKIRLKLEDIGYPSTHASKSDEILAWYTKEYEVLPLWYKRFGHLLQVFTRKKKLADIF